MTSIAQQIVGVLAETDIETKLVCAERVCAARSRLVLGDLGIVDVPQLPGRPPSWTVQDNFKISRRPSLETLDGRRRLLHSVANIELSAVELALLAVVEFPDESLAYHEAMLGIAAEEVVHCRMVINRLRELDMEFGEEVVHLELWKTAREHAGIVERLAVVPRILEARGLDVSGRLRRQIRGAGDEQTALVLDRIYADEVGHVAVGTYWYRQACSRRGLDSEQHFLAMLERFRPGRPTPVDREGRIAAGFTEREIEAAGGP